MYKNLKTKTLVLLTLDRNLKSQTQPFKIKFISSFFKNSSYFPSGDNHLFFEYEKKSFFLAYLNFNFVLNVL